MDNGDQNSKPSSQGQALIQVEVAYATPDKQLILSLKVPEGVTMFEAAERSNIVEHFPEIVLEQASMGIFGRLEKKPKQRVLKDQERVEIYRPLQVDPKEIRRRRAEQARKDQ